MERHLHQRCWLLCGLLAVVLTAAGCEQDYRAARPADPARGGPPAESILPEHINAAFEATGSLEAWLKAGNLHAQAVVSFYNPDGSYYLTEQVHEIAPWAGSIRISADEPQGSFVWQLSNEGFEVLQGKKRSSDLPVTLCDRNLATVILDTITGPIRLFNNAGLVPLRVGQTVKIEGKWYYPIELQEKQKDFKRIFYQSTDSSLLDVVRLIDAKNRVFLVALGYDYWQVKEFGIIVPAKIEIFKTNANGARGRKLVQISYHTLPVLPAAH